ncbi:MAG: hypothetical protein PUB09_05175, partial [Firmicutes bacterium]|nr:hypothetical protein [Bacillota bacterium]
MSELKKTDQFDVKERCRELSEYMFTILEKNKDALDANTLSYVAFGIPMISVEVMRRIDDHKSHLQTEILKSAEKNLLGCKGYKGTEELLVDRRLFFAFYSTIEDYGKRTEVRDELLKKVRALALAFAGTNHNSKVDVDKSIKFITGLITYCAVNEYEEVYKLEEQGVFRGFSSQIDECSESTMKQIAEEKKAKADKIRKDRTNKSIKLVALIVGVILLGVIAAKFVLPEIQYNRACSLYELNEYDEAIAKFEELKGYKDSNVKLLDCKYDKACALKDEKRYDEAIGIFEE